MGLLEEGVDGLGVRVVFFGEFEGVDCGLGVGGGELGVGAVEQGGEGVGEEVECLGAVGGGAFGIVHL